MPCCDKNDEVFEGRWFEHPLMRNALIGALIAGIAFGLGYFKIAPHLVTVALYVVAIVISSFAWAKEGIEELVKKREIGIEFLMLSAMTGAGILGLWDEAAILAVLYGAAEGLEEYNFAKTRASIRKLLDLAPKEARVRKDGQEVMVPAESLQVGDVFLVKPGESLPTDGEIVLGQSSINEAAVTGESVPVEKGPGTKVFAATIVQDGLLEIRTTASFENNTLSKMVHMIEEAREQKGKAQRFIEEFGEKYSPAVFIVAMLVMIVPPLFFGAAFGEWATRAIVMLVAGAPCALVMSTPVAIAAGIGTAGKNGVLVKGGMHLENLGKLKGVAFDKTGTLTVGKPEVTDIVSMDGNDNQLMRIALSLEQSSTHPLAGAIVSKASDMKVEAAVVEEFRSLTGAGVQGRVENELYYLGKPKLFEEFGIEPNSQTKKLSEQGKTVVLVGTEQKILGLIAIKDAIRPEAKQVVADLHKLGMKVAMLTGDNSRVAHAIAQELQIEDVRAELKPEDKIAAIEELQKQYGSMAMVGDGINDAPALARATVGIAMGTAGTDAAIEAADTALMGDDLTKVIYAIRLGQRAQTISKQNIVFSLALLAGLIPAALFGLITVAMAVIFHEVSELLAVANGLRVTRAIR